MKNDEDLNKQQSKSHTMPRILQTVLTIEGIAILIIIFALFFPTSPIHTVKVDLSNIRNITSVEVNTNKIPPLPYFLYTPKVVIGSNNSTRDNYDILVYDMNNRLIVNIKEIKYQQLFLYIKGNNITIKIEKLEYEQVINFEEK